MRENREKNGQDKKATEPEIFFSWTKTPLKICIPLDARHPHSQSMKLFVGFQCRSNKDSDHNSYLRQWSRNSQQSKSLQISILYDKWEEHVTKSEGWGFQIHAIGDLLPRFCINGPFLWRYLKKMLVQELNFVKFFSLCCWRCH